MRILTEFYREPLLFDDPIEVHSCRDPRGLKECLEKIDRSVAAGNYAAGFISYEAGYCFEKKLFDVKERGFPLVMMGIYKSPVRRTLIPARTPAYRLTGSRLNITKEKYFENIAVIRELIARGDVYQITYCLKMMFGLTGDPLRLYKDLLRAQPVPYPAYIKTDDFSILSLSPEKFIRKRAAHIESKPMKGTWPRGGNIFEDIAGRIRFQFDKKNRAENIMIADLLRNDLGRVANNIKAPRLFEIAGYKTLYQMTSTVTGAIDKDISLYELMAAIFPSGSVTGAPRIRAMEVVRDIEADERNIYTGAIGYITPGRDMFFNIPIRTVLVRGDAAEMGIGGGIVWDSTPEGEWAEGRLKMKFVTDLFDK